MSVMTAQDERSEWAMMGTSIDPRFFAKIEESPNGCWLWTGAQNGRGYGKLRRDNKNWLAHRFIYEMMVGVIPYGLDLDHTCHNEDLSCNGGPSCIHRRCVNPSHLLPATCSENHLRGRSSNRRKTHCPKGHPYSGDNLVVRIIKGAPRRFCLTCQHNYNEKLKLSRHTE